MVKELLTPDRIKLVKNVPDWRTAFALAAEPILRDGSVTHAYVEMIISNVEQHGPYVVLADRFAVPHAWGKGCVNRPALALLQVQEPVDLLGKPVNVFLVLASPDTQSHIAALASLTQLLYSQSSMAVLEKGEREEILEIIRYI